MKRIAKFLFLTMSTALLASCGQGQTPAEPGQSTGVSDPTGTAAPTNTAGTDDPDNGAAGTPEPTDAAGTADPDNGAAGTPEPTDAAGTADPDNGAAGTPEPTDAAGTADPDNGAAGTPEPTDAAAPTDAAGTADPDNDTAGSALPEGYSVLCPEEISQKRPDVTYGTVVHKTYASKTTGLDRGVNILLPPNYDETKKYPVLYLLHGIFGNEYSLIQDASCKIPEISGNLAADGLAEEMLIVFPDMYAKTDPAQAPGFSAEAVAPYDNFINDLVNDLIPYIEENFSVLTDRENRAIAGFSMGGRETLFIGFSRPDLFSSVGAIAPAPGLTPGRDWAMSHPGQFQEEELVFDASAEVPDLMVCCGDSDKTVGKFPESYHKIMTANGVEHIWYEVPGADHDSTAIRSGLNNFLSSIFR